MIMPPPIIPPSIFEGGPTLGDAMDAFEGTGCGWWLLWGIVLGIIGLWVVPAVIALHVLGKF